MSHMMMRPGVIPPRPVSIHRDGHSVVTFEGFGAITVNGPRRTELVGMVSALPLILRQLFSLTALLRDRDGASAQHVMELEAMLQEVGLDPFSTPIEEASPVPTITEAAPTGAEQRFVTLLGAIAAQLDAILEDRKSLHSTPMPIRTALAGISSTIKATLRDTGHGDALPAEPTPARRRRKRAAVQAPSAEKGTVG